MAQPSKEKRKEYNHEYYLKHKKYRQRYNYANKENRVYKDIVKWWNERRESGELVIVDGKAMLKMNRK